MGDLLEEVTFEHDPMEVREIWEEEAEGRAGTKAMRFWYHSEAHVAGAE